MKKLTALVFLVTLFGRIAHAETGFKTDNIILYQPETVLQARVPDVQVLADYAKRMEAACNEHLATTERPDTFAVVVAVKPGKVVRMWFVVPGLNDPTLLEPLRKKLEAVPAMEVSGGSVVFAMMDFPSGGGGESKIPLRAGPPVPQEWQDAVKDIKGSIEMPDGYLKAVWSEASGKEAGVNTSRVEGVQQALYPLSYTVLRPKDWLYMQGHGRDQYAWRMSKEDPAQGNGYEASMRIDMLFTVKESTGKSSKQLIQDFIESRKKGGGRIVATSPEKVHGLFMRTELEMEEGDYRFLYSLFWGTGDSDAAVISVASARKQRWKEYADVFFRMSVSDLVGDWPKFLSATEVSTWLSRQFAQKENAVFHSRNGRFYGMDSDSVVSLGKDNKAVVGEFGVGYQGYRGTYAIAGDGTISLKLAGYRGKWPDMKMAANGDAIRLHASNGDSSFVFGGRGGAMETPDMAPFWPFALVDTDSSPPVTPISSGGEVKLFTSPALPQGFVWKEDDMKFRLDFKLLKDGKAKVEKSWPEFGASDWQAPAVDAAIRSLESWTFYPYRNDGVPIEMNLSLEFKIRKVRDQVKWIVEDNYNVVYNNMPRERDE